MRPPDTDSGKLASLAICPTVWTQLSALRLIIQAVTLDRMEIDHLRDLVDDREDCQSPAP
jgi:hypothetical protein